MAPTLYPQFRRQLSRRRFGLLLAATTGAAGVGSLAPTAATVTDEPVGDIRNYPGPRIVATDTEVTLPVEIEAERYVVTNENPATLGESAPTIIRLAVARVGRLRGMGGGAGGTTCPPQPLVSTPRRGKERAPSPR